MEKVDVCPMCRAAQIGDKIIGFGYEGNKVEDLDGKDRGTKPLSYTCERDFHLASMSNADEMTRKITQGIVDNLNPDDYDLKKCPDSNPNYDSFGRGDKLQGHVSS